MSFWDLFRSKKTDRAASASGAVIVNSPDFVSAPQRGTVELLRAWRTQPWLRAVTSRIGRSVGVSQWVAYARSSEPERKSVYGRMAPVFDVKRDFAVKDLRLTRGDLKQRNEYRQRLLHEGLLRELPAHPMLNVLELPNALIPSGGDARFVTQLWLDLIGCAYWVVKRNPLGMPTGFFPVPAHWISKIRTTEGMVNISIANVAMQIKTSDVVRFNEPDPLDPYGQGTGIAQALSDELETDEYAAKFLKAWFYNSAVPSMLISFDGATQPQLQEFRAKWEEQYRGVSNAHRLHVGSGKMNAQRLDSSFKDQQIQELRKWERDTIIQVFSCPPEMVGIIENSNRSTIGAAEYIFAHGVQLPRLDFMRAQLQAQFVPMFDERIGLEFEVNLPQDPARVLDVMRAMPGAFALNEWRGEAGYKPVPEFDGVYAPLGLPGQQLESGVDQVDKETAARNWSPLGKEPVFVASKLGFELNRPEDP